MKSSVIGLAVACLALAGCAGKQRTEARSASKMNDPCPLSVAGAQMQPSDVVGGIALDFTTKRSDVGELRRKVEEVAEMQNKHPAGRTSLPAASAMTEPLNRGARLVLRPENPEQIQTLRQSFSGQTAGGVCSMLIPTPRG